MRNILIQLAGRASVPVLKTAQCASSSNSNSVRCMTSIGEMVHVFNVSSQNGRCRRCLYKKGGRFDNDPPPEGSRSCAATVVGQKLRSRAHFYSFSKARAVFGYLVERVLKQKKR